MIKRSDFADDDGEICHGQIDFGGTHSCLRCKTVLEMRISMGSFDLDSEPENFEGADQKGYLSLCKNCLHLAWFDEDRQKLRELTIGERRDLKRDPEAWAQVMKAKEQVRAARRKADAIERAIKGLFN